MKSKKRTAAYIAVTLILLLGIVLWLLPVSWTVLDTTKGKLITLSEETQNLLKSLDEDVTLRHITEDDNGNKTVDALLERYADECRRVTFRRETGGQTEQIIVETASDSRTLLMEETYQYVYNEETRKVEGTYLLEQQVSAAVYQLTSPNVPVLYAAADHEEEPLDDSIKNILQQAGVKIESFAMEDGIPEDGVGVLIAGAKEDISEAEADALSAYLEEGHYLLLVSDALETETPNLNRVLGSYGAQKENGVVFEGDSGYMIDAQNPYYIVPAAGSEEVSDFIVGHGTPPLLTLAHGIRIEDPPAQVEADVILKSSESAYLKELTSQSMEKSDGDLTGPFNLAVTLKNKETGARIDWFASSSMLVSSINEQIQNADIDLIAETLRGACGAKIPDYGTKEMADYSVRMTKSAISGWSLGMFCIPLLLLLIGLYRKSRVQ